MSAAHLRKERVLEYIEDLDRQLADLERLSVPSADFLADPANFERTKAIKFSLACAIQDVTRIALHITTALGLGSVRNNEAESIEALASADVIPRDFAARIAGMAAFRNRLIHDYLPDKFNSERLFENLQRLDDFRTFAGLIGEWLEKNEI